MSPQHRIVQIVSSSSFFISLTALSLTAAGCGDDHPVNPTSTANSSTQPNPTANTMAKNSSQATSGGSTSTTSTGTMSPQGMALTIPFAAMVGQQELRCGTSYPNLGTSKSTAEFLEFALYIHKVELRNAAGQWVPFQLRDDQSWQKDGVALLDFMDHGSMGCKDQGTAETNAMISGTVAPGTYTGLRFVLGVPQSHNHLNAGTAVAPFNRSRMWWSWASGFRYIKADLKTATTKADNSTITKEKYYLHLGGTGCSKDATTQKYSCKDVRLATVEMDFVPGRDGIVVDAGALFSKDNLAEGRGCMGASNLKDPQDGKDVKPDSCSGQYLAIGLNTTGEVATPSGNQILFTPKPWSGAAPQPKAIPSLAEVDTPDGRKNPNFWPRSDYKRSGSLNLSLGSVAAQTRSHPVGDPRFGSQCLNCHQNQGPGLGQFLFGGTIYREDGTPYNEGWIEIVTGQGKSSWTAKAPDEKVPNPQVHLRIPIDGHGQFFATKDIADKYAAANNVPAIDYHANNYQAYVLNRDGHRVMAMSPKKSGSCNQCHRGGFRIEMPKRLESGVWMAEGGGQP